MKIHLLVLFLAGSVFLSSVFPESREPVDAVAYGNRLAGELSEMTRGQLESVMLTLKKISPADRATVLGILQGRVYWKNNPAPWSGPYDEKQDQYNRNYTVLHELHCDLILTREEMPVYGLLFQKAVLSACYQNDDEPVRLELNDSGILKAIKRLEANGDSLQHVKHVLEMTAFRMLERKSFNRARELFLKFAGLLKACAETQVKPLEKHASLKVAMHWISEYYRSRHPEDPAFNSQASLYERWADQLPEESE